MQPLADLRLVAVHPRRVDVAVAELERVADCDLAVAAGDLPGAEPELRDLDALDGEGLGLRGFSGHAFDGARPGAP